MENLKVSDLIEPNGVSWNWNVINGLFNNHDRAAIAKMVLLNTEGEDKRIWKFNQQGHYTVESAYRYAMETLVDMRSIRYRGSGISSGN
jgi:hypothetical protein